MDGASGITECVVENSVKFNNMIIEGARPLLFFCLKTYIRKTNKIRGVVMSSIVILGLNVLWIVVVVRLSGALEFQCNSKVQAVYALFLLPPVGVIFACLSQFANGDAVKLTGLVVALLAVYAGALLKVINNLEVYNYKKRYRRRINY